MIVNIDGRECVCEKGEILLAVAQRNGIAIPTLCHHDGLPGQGCCRVCIVEVEENGRRRVVTACVFPVERACHVYVNSDTIQKQRRMILALLKSRAPEAELAADIPPERFVRQEGKCILCGLCARACESVGSAAITTVHRGTEKAVATPYDEPAKDCIGCGSCARVCPTSAIELHEDEDSRTIWNRTFALVKCADCGEVLGTREELAHAGAATGLCESCRRQAVSDVLARTYGV